MNYQEYIKSELLVLIPVLYLIGMGLKKSKIPDRWIPLILGVSGVLLAAIWILSTADIHGIQDWLAGVFTAITQGILLAGASVYANQIYVQRNKEE